MIKRKNLNRDTEFFPKLIGVPEGGKSDPEKRTGIYHPKNIEIIKRFQEHNLKTASRFLATCDPTKPAIGLTFHDYAGNRLMDFFSHVGVNTLGYNYPKIIEMQKKIFKYGIVSFIGAGMKYPIVSESIPNVVNLNEKLVEVARKNGFKKIARVGGWHTGTEAVENCMKIAYDWKKRKLFKKWGKNAEENWKTLEAKLGYPLFGIATDKCFHGRTFGALTLIRSDLPQYKYFPRIPSIRHMPYICKDSDKEFNIYELVDTKTSLEKVLKDNKLLEKIKNNESPIPIELLAFIIIEPFQGEGGYNIPKKKFIRDIINFCQANDVVCIDDEVQAGMGRSGKFFALNHFVDSAYNVVIAMAKAIQCSTVLIEDEMNYEQSGRASSTSGYGRLSDIAIGYARLEAILENDGALMKNATKMGNYFKNELKKINNGKLTRIDNLGLLVVTDFETQEIRDKAYQELLERGIVTLSTGVKGIRWIPSLDVKKQEIDYAIKKVEEVLNNL